MEGVVIKRCDPFASDSDEDCVSSTEVTEQEKFHKLYRAVIDGLARLACLEDYEIESAIDDITSSFHYSKGRQFSDVNLEEPSNVCGYLHRFGPIHTAVVREKFLEAFARCDEFRVALESPQVNVVSLGGGPGSDFVGLCSALEGLRRDLHFSELNFLVVDSVRRWSSCLNQIELLLREDKGTDYGGASELLRSVEVNPSFVRVTLPGRAKKHGAYFDALKRADIVMMVKLLSVLDWDDRRSITQSVIKNMKLGSLLLFIDSPFYGEFFTELKIVCSIETSEKFNLTAPSQCRYGHQSVQACSAQLYVMKKECVPITRKFDIDLSQD